MVYGAGHFVRTDPGSGRTRIQWTYSFQLNHRRFPGDLGRIRDFLFRLGFLDREYAEMMRRSLAGNKARTEGNTPVVARWSNEVGRGVLCYICIRLEGYRHGSPQFH